MAKTLSLDSKDLSPIKTTPLSASRQRGVVASAEYVPMQFRLPPDFVKSFKQAALDNDMKLNELLIACFQQFMKSGKQADKAQ
jgi:hypothetical protein